MEIIAIVPLCVIRKLVGITPEEFSASYKRLVQRNFAEDEETVEDTIRDRNKEKEICHENLNVLLKRVNTTRNSIDEDGDSVLIISSICW